MTPGEELARYLGAPTSSLDGTKIVPMLCEREEAGERVLSREGWLFELKLDGVRVIADKRGDAVSLTYRKLRDATRSYPEIADAVRALSDARLVLDGEIVAFDEHGRPDFQRLGHRIQMDASKRPARAPAFVPVVYVVFDVLALGPYDLRGFPLEARKEVLARVIPAEGTPGGSIRRHPTFESGVELFRLCQEHRLEGVVAKRLGSTYRAGERSPDWLKIKAELDAEFVVIGWTEGESDRALLGALDLGAYEGDRLVFRGRVGSGLDASTIDMLLERLGPIEVPHPVAEGKYSPKPKRHHCLPAIVVSVRYGGFSVDPSGARFLRFPVFRGVRPDVSPRDCTAAPDDGLALAAPGDDPGDVRPARARRIHVTAPSQPLLHDGTTKAALAAYFEAVAPALLRRTRGRVCDLRRPDGSVLWPPPKWTPKLVRTTMLPSGEREVRGFVVDSADALLFAVEAGSPFIEHGALIEDQPDVVTFVVVRVAASASASALTSAEKGALAASARAVRDVAAEIGLPAAAQSANARAIDVRVGVGAAPSPAAAPLGALLAHLVEARAGVTVAAAETVSALFAPCLGARAASVTVAVPLAWEELDEVELGALDLAAATARAETKALEDALDAVERADVDVAAATKALERVLTSRGAPE